MDKINSKNILASLFILYMGYILRYYLNAYVANHVSPILFGDFSLALRLMMVFGSLYLLGVPYSIIKYASRFKASNDKAAMIKFGKWAIFTSLKTMLSVILLLMTILATFLLLDHYQIYSLDSYHTSIYFQIFTPLLSVTLFLCAFLLAFKKSILVNVVDQLLRNLAFILCFTILFLIIKPEEVHAFHLALAIAFGLLITLLAVVILSLFISSFTNQFKRIIKADILKVEQAYAKKWSFYGKKIAIISSIHTLHAFLDLLIIEVLNIHGEHNVGYYAACLTIITLFFVTKKGIFQVVKPHIAAAKDKKMIQLMANKIFKFLAVFIFLQSGFIIFFSKTLLSFFGPSYINYYSVLIILTIGQCIAVMPSFAMLYLEYHGFEKFLLIGTTILFVLTLLFGSLSYYFFGLIGIAIVTSCILILYSYCIFYFAKKQSGIKFMFIA